MCSILKINSLTASIQNKGGNELPIVDGISFSVEPGEIVGLVGESGCGKSMTALSIMKLLPQNIKIKNESEILLNNQDISKLSQKEMRKIRGKEISMIFQEPMTSLNPVMKIGIQVSEIIELHQKKSRKETKGKVIELLKTVGIPRPDDIYEEYPHQLSGGMQQRIMIAIAIACNPKLLIADEPTTALDVTIQAQILIIMKQLIEERQMSILMITHDLGVVAEMCDKVIIMYAGKIVEIADVETLFAAPNHPYTKGLIQSLPTKGIGQTRLNSIPGNVPPIDSRPMGCSFAPRCFYAMDKCYNSEPPKFYLEKLHSSSCWLNELDKPNKGVQNIYGQDT